jgi:hypothetical protein
MPLISALVAHNWPFWDMWANPRGSAQGASKACEAVSQCRGQNPYVLHIVMNSHIDLNIMQPGLA